VIKIDIVNDCAKSLVTKNNSIVGLSTKVLSLENFNCAEISIILSNREFVSNLKKQYFNVDVFTDVIAFNLEDKGDAIDGEVYISIEDVLENSKKYNITFNDEFKRVLIHGLLHLLGYDDKTEKQKNIMRTLENKYMLLSKNTIASIS
jgi:probable rRNA maturation factor